LKEERRKTFKKGPPRGLGWVTKLDYFCDFKLQTKERKIIPKILDSTFCYNTLSHTHITLYDA
jgi:hypothetical protein